MIKWISEQMNGWMNECKILKDAKDSILYVVIQTWVYEINIFE